jgi:hypothetical protein
MKLMTQYLKMNQIVKLIQAQWENKGKQSWTTHTYQRAQHNLEFKRNTRMLKQPHLQPLLIARQNMRLLLVRKHWCALLQIDSSDNERYHSLNSIQFTPLLISEMTPSEMKMKRCNLITILSLTVSQCLPDFQIRLYFKRLCNFKKSDQVDYLLILLRLSLINGLTPRHRTSVQMYDLISCKRTLIDLSSLKRKLWQRVSFIFDTNVREHWKHACKQARNAMSIPQHII